MNIYQVIISTGWGGAETVVHELSSNLSDNGENVYILLNQEILKYYTDLVNVKLLNAGPLFNTTGLIRACIFPQIQTHAQEKADYSPARPSYLNALLREIYYKRLRDKLTQSIIDNRIDIIHSHLNLGTVLIANLRNELCIPMIATLHGQSVPRMQRRGFVEWLTSPVASWRREQIGRALAKVDRVTSVSKAELDVIRNCDITLLNNCVIIPNGVNIREIQGSLTSATALKGEFNLLFPGGAKFVKGGDLLVKALPKVKEQIANIHLYVAGNVPQNHPLRRIAVDNKLENHVTFTGFLGIQEYRQLLNSVDLLVMPSREDAFGIVFLEAMALGKPVIGGNTGGIPEVIKNGRNGILVKPDPDQIAEAILCLYQNRALRQEISDNNLRDISEFDWRGIVKLYTDLYRTVLGHCV